MLVFIVLLIKCASCDNIIDIDDILDVKLMPGSLLLLENSENTNLSYNEPLTDVVAGTFDKAFNTMDFHRSKMNEYLCRSFVADQILSDLSLTRIKRRLGAPQEPPENKMSVPEIDVKEQLLFDEGSSNYKQWLSKSTTLEDVYRHYERTAKNDIDDVDVASPESDSGRDEYDAEVTGYVMATPHVPQKSSPTKLTSVYANTGTYHSGSDSRYGAYGAHNFAPQHVHYYPTTGHEDVDEKDGKGLLLNDLFEIALTAIAFVSFGCFVLQVVMCIGAAGNTTTAMPMQMMPMAPGDDVEPLNLIGRNKRSARDNQINELARRVLASIEAAFVAEEDDGNCLRRTLCESNKRARSMHGPNKMWMPIWSFGMSWLSGRLMTNVSSTASMLESLKASILGLGNANCKVIYKCGLKKLREKQRKRKRRSTNK